ncbi:hypothetical protein GGR08_001051 [Bartonella fuyuanensis]|uniref:Uncharacterized protein n=1 Tax=Bartonella fuyuanensis TaxID=1460968 RepID=A0A840DUF2_9HYPH|nr:hypothetical protein [Bartonella fuyuanensis]MBB4076744.1 hypothetical protein [Bartonella fuyuanensis]
MTVINTSVARLATTQHSLSIVLSISQPSQRTMPPRVTTLLTF